MKINVAQYNAFTESYFKCGWPRMRYGQAFMTSTHMTFDDFHCIKDYRDFWNTTDIGWCRHYIEHNFIDYETDPYGTY